MTLGIPFTVTQPTAPTNNDMLIRTPSYPFTRNANRILFGFGSGIYSTTDGVNFTQELAGGADSGQCAAIITPLLTNGPAGLTFAGFSSETEATTGTARYQVSTDGGATWADGASDKVLHDMIWWDNKVIAVWGTGIIFGVWDATAGNEVWNIDDTLDAEFVGGVISGHIHFIGVAPAPWGEPAVYFTDEGTLYVLDFYARKNYIIDMGVGGTGARSCMWNGNVVVSDSWNVFLYNPGAATVRNIGFPRADGVVPNLHQTGGDYEIWYLLPSNDYLYAIVSDPTLANTYLYVYNGIGWSQLGPEFAGVFANVAMQNSFPPVGETTSRRIYMAGAATSTTNAFTIASYLLPNLSHIPAHGVDPFGSSGASWETGWIDGGFSEIEGTLLRMNIDAFNLSSTSRVGVEYRIDNDENTAYIPMVDINNLVDFFDDTTGKLYFSSAFPHRGVQFRTVQFRFTLFRGPSDVETPEVKAFTLVFLKTPLHRSAWSFRIDINRMIETSATGLNTTFFVDGVAATVENVWEKLRSLWNTHELLPFIIPNVEGSLGIDVKITDIPMTFDDFRNAVKGLGNVQIQVLEPVPRA